MAMISSKNSGFTIVELLIVIVIIGILSTLVVVTYNGIQQRALYAQQDADMSQLVKAVVVAREAVGLTFKDITLSSWSGGGCSGPPGNNVSSVEPATLPKTHACWTKYYNVLNTIAAASNTNLDGLKKGDNRGNPYFIDENEAESLVTPCTRDSIRAYTGVGVATRGTVSVPNSLAGC